jgi:hypothetical protein
MRVDEPIGEEIISYVAGLRRKNPEIFGQRRSRLVADAI